VSSGQRNTLTSLDLDKHIYAYIHTYVYIYLNIVIYIYIYIYIWSYMTSENLRKRWRFCCRGSASNFCLHICIFVHVHVYQYIQLHVCTHNQPRTAENDVDFVVGAAQRTHFHRARQWPGVHDARARSGWRWVYHVRCVAVCCSVLQCVAVCYSVLQWVAGSKHLAYLMQGLVWMAMDVSRAFCCRTLQSVAVSCSVLQWVVVSCSCEIPGVHDARARSGWRCMYHVRCVAVCCRVLQCVAVCCSVP